MFAESGTLGLSFVAGVLSILSPCVLPLLPILIGAAVTKQRYGPVAVALGLGSSYTLAGVALASLGLYLGFNQGWLRNVAAVMLVVFGAVLVSTTLQSRFAVATTAMSRAGNAIARRLSMDGYSGQFALGFVLGLIWSPCVGPTLGAAVTLASQSQALGRVTLVMLVFGIGAALPLALVGTLSREAALGMRGKLMDIGFFGKYVLGIALIVTGAAILAGFDKGLEAALVQWSPDWLTELTMRY